MKRLLTITMVLIILAISYIYAVAQDDVTVVAASSEAAEGLDLHAVAELFKDCNNLEDFERALNDPDNGINNLDLDNNGEVDFIRVVSDNNQYYRLVILQVPLGDNEFQDVATIEVDRDDRDVYTCRVIGNEIIYGPDYYYAVPDYVYIPTWPIIVWFYGPAYHPYRSAYYYHHWPHWWRPYHPVAAHVYRTRTVKYTNRSVFSLNRGVQVTAVRKVEYKPSNSVLVKKQTTVVHKSGGTTEVKKVIRTHDGKVVKTTGTTEVKKVETKKEGAVHKTTGTTEVKKTSKSSTVKKTPDAKERKSVKKTSDSKSSSKLNARKTTERRR